MSRVGRDSVLVTVLNTAAQGASLVLFAGIARLFGANASTDAFFLALTLPTVLIGPVVSSVRTVLIPIIVEARTHRPEAQGQFMGCVLSYTLLFSLVAVIGLVLLAPIVVPAAAGGLTPENRARVVRLTLLLLPLVAAQSLSAVLSAAYNAVERFTLPALAAGVRHLVALAVIIASHRQLGVLSLPLGFVIGALIQLAVLAGWWASLGIRIEWNMRPSPEWKRSVSLAVPLILASIILYLAVLVTRFLAAWLPPGSVTVLDYAMRINIALMEVLTSGVLVVVLSRWSSLVQSAPQAINASLQRSVVLVLFGVAPVLVALFVLRVPAVSLVMGQNAVEPAMVMATATLLAILLVGVPLDIVARIYSRVFLVRQATWVNAAAASIRLAVVTALAFVLIRGVGLNGLAIAETAGVASVTLFLAWMARAAIGSADSGTIVRLISIGAIALISGLAGAGTARWLGNQPPIILLTAGSAATFLVYALLARLVRADELRVFTSLLRIRSPGVQ